MTTNTFIQQGLKEIKKLRNRKDNYIGEEIRQRLNSKGIFASAPQAYGALIRKAVNDGLLIETGYERPRARSRMATEYRVAA